MYVHCTYVTILIPHIVSHHSNAYTFISSPISKNKKKQRTLSAANEMFKENCHMGIIKSSNRNVISNVDVHHSGL